MLSRSLAALLFAVTLILTSHQALAGGAGNCSCGHCEPQHVQKTIYVPTWVNEKRLVTVTHYEREPRQRTYTVYKCVPETKQVTRKVTVMVPKLHTKTVMETVCVRVPRTITREMTVMVPKYRTVEQKVHSRVPEYKTVTQEYTVMQPYREKQIGTRTVCKLEPKQVVRTRTCDRGHWTTRTLQVACRACGGHGCGGCGHGARTICEKVWVPHLVTENYTCTVHEPKTYQETYEYYVTRCKPVKKTRQVRLCSGYKTVEQIRHVRVCDYEPQTRTCTQVVYDYKNETRERKVTYTVCEPEERTHTDHVTTYKQVPEQKTETFYVCKPVPQQKEVVVSVCKMMPKTIMVPVHRCGRRR